MRVIAKLNQIRSPTLPIHTFQKSSFACTMVLPFLFPFPPDFVICDFNLIVKITESFKMRPPRSIRGKKKIEEGINMYVWRRGCNRKITCCMACQKWWTRKCQRVLAGFWLVCTSSQRLSFRGWIVYIIRHY